MRSQGDCRTVVVSGMALEAEKGLAHLEEMGVHGSVRRMAFQAVLGHRGVLVREGSLVLCMTLEAELIPVRPEVVSGPPAVRIVAVRATHLGFTDGVAKGEIHFGGLCRVASGARLGLCLALIECDLQFVDAMAVDAANVFASMDG